MKQNIYCLMVGNTSLTSRMCDVLFDAACLMVRDGVRRKKMKDEEFEGEIHTTLENRSLGSIYGTEFIAKVETERGTGSVKFLVRPIDVERRNELAWVPFASIDDMIANITSPPGRSNAAFN